MCGDVNIQPSEFACNAERRSGRVLWSSYSNIVSTFQHASLSPSHLFRRVGSAVSPLMCFDCISMMPVDRGEPIKTYAHAILDSRRCHLGTYAPVT